MSPDQPTSASPGPMNVIVVLLDSLNRHLLGAYGSEEFDTPNLDRFARRSVRFDNHLAGSLPCIPARHDLLCGAYDFPWRPWGSVEVWEEPLTVPLRKAGITTKLVSDHPHLFEVGGENYHCDFTAWDYQRGHEGDPWKTRPDPSYIGSPSYGRTDIPYEKSRGWFNGEEDFPGPRTMAAAAKWLENDAPFCDRFFLMVDEFDPHEPFDTPEPYASMYDPDWAGPHLIWPPYVIDGVASGVLSEADGRQIRASYGSKLTMIDHWFGKLIDVLDRRGSWEDTVVVVCTDHGHYLGERDMWGKPGSPLYEPMVKIPLMIAWPGVEAGSREALTTTVDIHATVLEVFGAKTRHVTHGKSLTPLLAGTTTSIREHALAGVWSREIHLITTETKYARAPVGANEPLSLWSNRWSTMPVHFGGQTFGLPRPNMRATLDQMPGSRVPVIRQPFVKGDMLPFWAMGGFSGNHLYDLAGDPGEQHNLAGTAAEKEMARLLHDALKDIEVPGDQLVRLGLQ